MRRRWGWTMGGLEVQEAMGLDDERVGGARGDGAGRWAGWRYRRRWGWTMGGLEVQERSGMLQEEAGETAVLADTVCGPGTLALP